MADKISYTINDWHKSDVLTAEKLNATEAALAQVVAMINGNSDSQDETLEKSKIIASEGYVDEAINSLNYTPTEDESHISGVLKTIASLTESNGIINATYQEIQKASGTNFGVVKAGTNLSASEGTLSVIDSPVLSGSLTLDGAFEHSIKADEQLQVKVPHEVLNAAYKTIVLGATPASLQDGGSWTGTITENNASTITLQGYRTIIDAPLILNDNFTHSTLTLDVGTSETVQPYGTFSAKYKYIVLGDLAKRYRKSDGQYLGVQTSSSTDISLYGNSTKIETDKLNVSSTSTFSNSLTVGKKTVANDTTTLSGSTTLYGTVNIEGGTILTGALNVSGSSTLSGGITTGNATITTATITNATITNISNGFNVLHSNSNDNTSTSLSTSLDDDTFSIIMKKDYNTGSTPNNLDICSINLAPIDENTPEEVNARLNLSCPVNIEVSADNAYNSDGIVMRATTNNGSQTIYSLTDSGHISLTSGLTCIYTDNNNTYESNFYIEHGISGNSSQMFILKALKNNVSKYILTHDFNNNLTIGDAQTNIIISGTLTIGNTTLTEQNLIDLLTLLS